MTATDGKDWYAANVELLAIVFACSISTFVLVFVIVTTCVRMRFSGQSAELLKTLDTPELVGIKSHTRATRLLSLGGIVLQVLLVLRLTDRLDDNDDDERSSSTAYGFSLFRPVSNLCVYFLGFMTNTHAFFRIMFLLLLGEMVVTDTIAQVTVTMVANCLQAQGLRCGNSPSSLSLSDLQFLQLRDLFCLFLNPWLALEVAYLGLTIGFCSSRYSSRRLSLSRPRFNIRAALAFYFPAQFSLNATQVHHLHASRRRHQPKEWSA